MIVFTLLSEHHWRCPRGGGVAGLAGLAKRLTTKPSPFWPPQAGRGGRDRRLRERAHHRLRYEPIATAGCTSCDWRGGHGIECQAFTSELAFECLALVSDQMRLEGLKEAASSPLLLLLSTTPYRLYPCCTWRISCSA